MQIDLSPRPRSFVRSFGHAVALLTLGAVAAPACAPSQGDTADDRFGAADLESVSAALVVQPGSHIYQAGLFSCAIVERGAVKCWGSNSAGQLGLGNTIARGDNPNEMGDNLPFVDLGRGRTATSLALGKDFACALLDSAQIKCWGFNGQGQLGQGDVVQRGDGPGEMGDALGTVALGVGRAAKAISAGFQHACAILDDNTLKCWGGNIGGQLGLGDTAARGDGPNEMGSALPTVPLGTGRTAKAISLGGYTTCALLDNNTLKCWGDNTWGQCGQGDTAARGDQPGELGDALPPIALGTGRTVKMVSADHRKTCAILDNNALKCWGLAAGTGTDGVQHGDGPGEMGDALPAVALGTGRTAVAVVGTGEKACALLDNATVKCWGSGSPWGLGYGDTKSRGTQPGQMGDALPAIDLGTGRTVKALSGGGTPFTTSPEEEFCAVLDNGKTKCWGPNFYGQIGLGTTGNPLGDNPNEMGNNLPYLDLGASRGAQSVVAGARHTCALTANGRVKCWGSATYGQLGLGSMISRGDGRPGSMGDALPTVDLGTGRTVKQLASNGSAVHTCALLDNNTVKCWGGNATGALGLGDWNNRGDDPGEMGDALPAVNLGTGRTARAVVAGMDFSCAILDNNTLKCWGANSYGALGQGSTTTLGDHPNEMGDALPAINLGAGRTAKAVAAGAYHVCAILDNNTVKCWGNSDVGQLGLGNTVSRGDQPGEMGDALPAVSFGTGRTAKAIAAGDLATCVLMDNNQVKCWGDSSGGTLGYGDTVRRGDQPSEMGDALPTVNVGTGRSVKAISAGDGVVCVLRDDQSLACWGINNGSLGIDLWGHRGDNPNEMGDSLIPVILNSPPQPSVAPFVDPNVLPFVATATSCAVLSSGLLKCWGANDHGQLGLNDLRVRGVAPPDMETLPFVDLGTDLF